MMMMTNRDQKKLFYVVQFKESPFEGIDKYVCVPNSWLILRRSSNGKVVVTYPDNEDPFDTRDRVKRKEKPNEEWRLYMACIEYESENYEDTEYWIASKKDNDRGEEKSEIKGTQPKPDSNKKLRSAGQSFSSGLNSDKSKLKAKPNKNPRKLISRILIKRPLSLKPDENPNKKRLKLNKNANPGAVTDHTIIASGCSKKKQSIIITENEFTQIDQTKSSSALNGKMNTEQSTQPGVIKENQSVKMSIQSTSTKLTAEQHPSTKLSAQQQLSPQPPIEQQLSPQSTIDQNPSPHPLIDRQLSPKLVDEQHPSSKLSAEHRPSPIEQDDRQPLCMSVIDQDESDEDIESCQNDLPEPVTVERLSTTTPLKILKQAPQPELDNEKSTQLVHHEHSLPKQHPQDGSAEQTEKFNDSQKTHLHWILTAPRMELRPPSTVNQPSQHFEHFQLPTFPASSTLNSELRSAEFVGKNLIKVAGDHQTPRSRDCRDSTPSTSYHGANWGMLCEPVAKKQSAAVKKLKNPVDKKTRFKGDSRNITTMQYPLSSMMHLSLSGNPAATQTPLPTQNNFQQAQVNDIRCSREEKSNYQKVPVYQGIVNTSAEQNFTKLAHQYRPFVGKSDEQQYVPTQADYLQQFACLQEMLKRQTVPSTVDRRVYHQNPIMNGGFVVPNPIHQPVQFLPQNENQYIPVNSAYAQEPIRHDLMRGPIDGAHTSYKPNVQNGLKIQLVDRYSSSQSHQSSEHPQQIQYPPIYRDPCTASTQNDLIFKSKHSSQMPKPQKITERPPLLSTSQSPSQVHLEVQRSCLLQEQGMQGKINPNLTKYSNMNLAVENLTVEPAPYTQDAEVQTMTSSEIPHETQFTLIQRNHTYQLSRINKTSVDQATETDLMMNVDHCTNKIAGSSFGERASKLVDSECQTGNWLIEEQGLTYQKIGSDFETAAEQEIESENKLDSEVHDKNLTNVRNVTPKDQQAQSRIFAEQEILNAVGTLVTRVGTNLSITREIFNFFRNSTLECIQEYETLLKKVDEFNSIETLQIPLTPPNNVTSQVLQVTQERPAGDNDNITGVGDAVTPIREHRGKFSLPAEYDPNDTKWTLKYHENKPGLVELIPRTGVYVCRKELKRCIRQSNDCRTLVRLLLTEIFSQNALSVCSLTGGKAKAFNSLNIDVRPGLDEHARMVLLTFVEEQGNKQGWVKFDTPAVMSSIRTKINEIRAKHGQTCKV